MLRSLMMVVLAVSGFQAFGATPYKRTLSVKSNTYMKDGVFIGGKANEGTSLLGVRRAYSAKAKLERVIVDLGDHEAKPAGKNPGYFQVSMDSVNNRVVMDLAQLRFSKVTETQLQNIFRKSPNVSEASLTLDPEDKAATMVLKLKRPMRLEVFQLLDRKKPGRVVIDLTPMTAARSSSSDSNAALMKPLRRGTARAPAKKKVSREAFQ